MTTTVPVGAWIFAHRKGLRIGAVALAALFFVFWGHARRVRRLGRGPAMLESLADARASASMREKDVINAAEFQQGKARILA